MQCVQSPLGVAWCTFALVRFSSDSSASSALLVEAAAPAERDARLTVLAEGPRGEEAPTSRGQRQTHM
eukprot:8756187-Alexandrium_andersonii.AAC.1